MLRKLVIFAITSGLAARAYRAYAEKRQQGKTAPVAPANTVTAKNPAPRAV